MMDQPLRMFLQPVLLLRVQQTRDGLVVIAQRPAESRQRGLVTQHINMQFRHFTEANTPEVNRLHNQMLKFDINPRHAEGFDANLMILPDISIQGALTEHGARIPNPAHYCGMRVIGHQAQTSGCPIAT